MSLKDKATNAAKKTSEKASELADKAKKIDVNELKGQGQEKADSFNKLDNKKKAMIVGGAVIAVVLLASLFGGGSNHMKNIAKEFPVDADPTDQCEFIGEFYYSFGQLLLSKKDPKKIVAILKEDLRNPYQYGRTPQMLYYRLKKEAFEDVDEAAEDMKKASSSEIKSAKENFDKMRGKIKGECRSII